MQESLSQSPVDPATPFRLVVPAALWARMFAHAVATAPNECCGLLAGTLTDGVGTVTAGYEIVNAASSPVTFATDPRSLLAVHRAMREAGTRELAFYHSHPTSAAIPSVHDLRDNPHGEAVVHLIVSLVGEPAAAGWWLGETTYRPAAVEIVAANA